MRIFRIWLHWVILLKFIFIYFIYFFIILDGDDEPLYNNRGEKICRDLVQFVEFSKFEGNAQKLTQEVLHEIPKQVEDYFNLNM